MLNPRLVAGALALLVLAGLTPAAGAEAFDSTYAVYDQILRDSVRGDLVDYDILKDNWEQLQSYLATVARLSPEELADFSAAERLAYLINAYNAYALKLIIRHYPLKTVLDIKGAVEGTRFTLAGAKYNLEEIENDLIRKRFAEPRIHFALIDATRGGPPLRPGAYTATTLNDQLDEVARRFARSLQRNRLDREEGVLYVSKLFDWHSLDFAERWGETPLPEGSVATAKQRSIVGFFLEFGDEETAAALKEAPVRIEWLDYDWRLNDARQALNDASPE